MPKNESKTFALVHGSWHNAACWNLVQASLESRGHQTVAVDLPISVPGLTFDDYATTITEALDGRDNIVGVFHSRAGNYGPRAVNLLHAAGKPVVERMILVGAAFENSTSAALGHPKESEELPARNNPQSRIGLRHHPELGSYMTTYSPEAARNFLYHDIEDESLVLAALGHLRPQYRPPEDMQPTMQSWPDVPQTYIMCADDRMINPEWSICAAAWLGVEPVVIPGGHSPLLSRPEYLASVLIELSDTGSNPAYQPLKPRSEIVPEVNPDKCCQN